MLNIGGFSDVTFDLVANFARDRLGPDHWVGEIAKVKEAFAASSEAGMQSFDSALLQLYKSGKIGMEEALANADSRANLEASIHFN